MGALKNTWKSVRTKPSLGSSVRRNVMCSSLNTLLKSKFYFGDYKTDLPELSIAFIN